MAESKEVPTSSRRHIVRKFIDLAVGAVTGVVIGKDLVAGVEAVDSLITAKKPDIPILPPLTLTPFPAPAPAIRVAEPIVTPKPRPSPTEQPNQTQPEQPSNTDRLSQIASLQLSTPVRLAAEASYVSDIFAKNNPSTQDIDQGLWVITNPKMRQSLLTLRYNLRYSKADIKLTPLSDDKKEWTKEHGISFETLAIALDAYPKAKRILEAILKHDKAKFRPDIRYKEQIGLLPKGTFANLTAEQMMINPGGMAKLIITETGGITYEAENGQPAAHEGFTTIGQHAAWDETNISIFPTGHISLDNLAKMLQYQTNINYKTKNIPGSARGDHQMNASGGAVGIQIMPDNLMEILKIVNNPELQLADSDRWLNVFDLTDATVLAWIFLARGVKVSNEDDAFRIGYLRGPADKNAPESTKKYYAKLRNWAIKKWNPFEPQIDAIMQAADSYSDKFPN